MKLNTFAWLAVLGSIISVNASADDKGCAVWAGYAAKTMLNTGMGWGGALIIPKDPDAASSAPPTDGPFLGFQSIPYLTDDVKAAFKDDQKALNEKYEQLVIAATNATAEQQKEFTKQSQGNSAAPGGLIMGGFYGASMPPKVKELNKKTSALADAFKKALLTHGAKNNCTAELDSAIAAEQFKINQQMAQFNQQQMKSKTDRIKRLKKENRELISSLRECQTAAPSIANKISKQLEEIGQKAASSCPECDADALSGQAF